MIKSHLLYQLSYERTTLFNMPLLRGKIKQDWRERVKKMKKLCNVVIPPPPGSGIFRLPGYINEKRNRESFFQGEKIV